VDYKIDGERGAISEEDGEEPKNKGEMGEKVIEKFQTAPLEP